MKTYIIRYALKRYSLYREVGPFPATEIGEMVRAWSKKAYDVYAVEA